MRSHKILLFKTILTTEDGKMAAELFNYRMKCCQSLKCAGSYVVSWCSAVAVIPTRTILASAVICTRLGVGCWLTSNQTSWNWRKWMTNCKLFSHRAVPKATQWTCRHSLISACHVRLRSYWLSDHSGLMTSILDLRNRIVLKILVARTMYVSVEPRYFIHIHI